MITYIEKRKMNKVHSATLTLDQLQQFTHTISSIMKS